jgi:hypothetical protein
MQWRWEEVLCFRAGDKTEGWIQKNGGKGEEDLQLAYLLPWLGWPVGSQDSSWSWGKAMIVPLILRSKSTWALLALES